MHKEDTQPAYRVKFEVEGFLCLRCGHKWVPRVMTDREPVICPKCKSPYWNRPRKVVEQTQRAEETKKLRAEFKQLDKRTK